MLTLYIDRKGADLDHESGALVVRVAGERLGTMPLAAAERIVVRGAERLTMRLLAALWSRHITLVLLGGRRGELQMIQHGPAHGDARIRLRQYALAQDPAGRLVRGMRLVMAKSKAQRLLLRQQLAERPDLRSPLLDALATIEAIVSRLRNHEGADLDALLGLEGAAAAAYYRGFGVVLPPSLGFAGRNRRPPRDPVNACLSLGYTLLQADALREVHIAGLDPLIGFYHQATPGRTPSPAIWWNRCVWQLLRERTLRDAHFRRDDGACLLGKAGRQHFYGAYESIAPGLRRYLRRGCRLLVQSLRSFAPVS